jgi:hypothetical protein
MMQARFHAVDSSLWWRFRNFAKPTLLASCWWSPQLRSWCKWNGGMASVTEAGGDKGVSSLSSSWELRQGGSCVSVMLWILIQVNNVVMNRVRIGIETEGVAVRKYTGKARNTIVFYIYEYNQRQTPLSSKQAALFSVVQRRRLC